MIAGAIEALAASLQSADGRRIVYRRGAESVQIDAVPAQTSFEALSGSLAESISESAQSRDFLIVADALVLSAAVTLPQRGDEIDEVYPDATYTYEVRPPVEGMRPFRFMDTARTLLRVHTKQTA